MAKASFYQYFSSKEKLITECLNEYNRVLSTILKRLIDNSCTIKEFFKKWIRIMKKNAEKNNSFMGCPVANIGFQVTPDKQELRKKFNEIIDGWFDILTILFKKAVKNGEIPETSSFKILFREVFSINEGALIMWRMTGDKEYFDSILTSIEKVLR